MGKAFVEFTGTAKLDRRTKNLVHRLGPDDVAVIDHTDLDRVSAEELLESGVRVVLNVAPSQSGRFPNPGPLLLVRGGVRLIDVPGAALFDELSEGERVTVRAECRSEEERHGDNWLMREHRSGSLQRTIALPAAVSSDQG